MNVEYIRYKSLKNFAILFLMAKLDGIVLKKNNLHDYNKLNTLPFFTLIIFHTDIVAK